jgi:hypothetical protein
VPNPAVLPRDEFLTPHGNAVRSFLMRGVFHPADARRLFPPDARRLFPPFEQFSFRIGSSTAGRKKILISSFAMHINIV